MTAAAIAAPSEPPLRVTADRLVALRPDMLRFAQLQLRNREAAEDMVQDTIEQALRKAGSFAGRSSVKTWVFAILRNRIVDHLRQAAHTVTMSSLVGDGDEWQEQLESLFDQRGQWSETARPRAWQDPEEARSEREFWGVFETCLDHLPSSMARVFMMREFLGFESDEICRLLGLTISNCHVVLHRARLKLRDCMGRGWGAEGATC